MYIHNDKLWYKFLLCILDISSESIAAAKDRYQSDKMTGKGRRLPFSAEFYVADCTKVRTYVGIYKWDAGVVCDEYFNLCGYYYFMSTYTLDSIFL